MAPGLMLFHQPSEGAAYGTYIGKNESVNAGAEYRRRSSHRFNRLEHHLKSLKDTVELAVRGDLIRKILIIPQSEEPLRGEYPGEDATVFGGRHVARGLRNLSDLPAKSFLPSCATSGHVGARVLVQEYTEQGKGEGKKGEERQGGKGRGVGKTKRSAEFYRRTQALSCMSTCCMLGSWASSSVRYRERGRRFRAGCWTRLEFCVNTSLKAALDRGEFTASLLVTPILPCISTPPLSKDCGVDSPELVPNRK